MVNPITVDLTLFRNADYGETFNFADDGQALDFSDMVDGSVEIRRYEGEPGDPLATGSVDWTLGGGTLELRFALADIAALPAGPVRGDPAPFVYDVRLVRFSGERELWMRGAANVSAGVTVND